MVNKYIKLILVKRDLFSIDFDSLNEWLKKNMKYNYELKSHIKTDLKGSNGVKTMETSMFEEELLLESEKDEFKFRLNFSDKFYIQVRDLILINSYHKLFQ